MRFAIALLTLPLCISCATSRISGTVSPNVLSVANINGELPTEHEFLQLRRSDIIEQGQYGVYYGRLLISPITLPWKVAGLRLEAYKSMWPKEEYEKKVEEAVRENETKFCFALIFIDDGAPYGYPAVPTPKLDNTSDNTTNPNHWHGWLQQGNGEASQKGTFAFINKRVINNNMSMGYYSPMFNNYPPMGYYRSFNNYGMFNNYPSFPYYASYGNYRIGTWWDGTLCFEGHIDLSKGFGLHIEPRYHDDIRPIDLRWDVSTQENQR